MAFPRNYFCFLRVFLCACLVFLIDILDFALIYFAATLEIRIYVV